MDEPTTPPKTDTGTAGVIAPPPLIYLGVLAIGVALDRFWLQSTYDMPESLRWTLTVALVATGAIFIGLALGRFRRAGTPAPPWQPTTALVTEGVYKTTRNPMYVGFAFVYLGLALAFDAVLTAFLLIVVVLIMRSFVIAREERYMSARFGQPYLEYMARTPRWL